MNSLWVIESLLGGEKILYLVVSIGQQKWYGRISVNENVDTTTPAWKLVIKDTAQQLLNISGINRDIEDLDYLYFGGSII